MKKTIILLTLLLLIGCSSTKIYFCPRDDCQEHLINELNKAKTEINFMVYSFTDEKISDTLINLKNQGIKIKGVMEYQQTSKYSQYQKLKDAGINIMWDKNRASMHHKVFIIDDKITTTGSYNPTKNGNEKNNENFLIITDKSITKKYLEEFRKIT